MAINFNLARGQYNPLQMAIAGQQAGMDNRDRRQEDADDKRAKAIMQSLQQRMQQDPDFVLTSSMDFAELQSKRPDLAQAAMQRFQSLGAEDRKQYAKDMITARDAIVAGDPTTAARTLGDRIMRLQEQGRVPDDSLRALQSLGDPEKFVQGVDRMLQLETGIDLNEKKESSKSTANIRDYEYYQALLAKDPEAAAIFANKSGLSKLSPQEQAVLDLESAEKRDQNKSKNTRLTGYATSGVAAADQMVGIQRSLQLLDQVETGGFEQAKMSAKRFFGIDSADEGELAFRLGTNVLSQLRQIFGAAFTAEEGKRLENISANFGRSPEANKRILEETFKITQRAARRGARAAKDLGDDFTANEIQLALERAQEQIEKLKGSDQSGSNNGDSNQREIDAIDKRLLIGKQSSVLGRSVTAEDVKKAKDRGYSSRDYAALRGEIMQSFDELFPDKEKEKEQPQAETIESGFDDIFPSKNSGTQRDQLTPSTGILPEQSGDVLKNYAISNPVNAAALDVAGTIGTGTMGLVKGLYDGLIAGFGDDENYDEIIDGTMQQIGFEPQTRGGQQAMNAIGTISEAVGDVLLYGPSHVYAGIKSLPNLLTQDERADLLTTFDEERQAFVDAPARELGQDVMNIFDSPAAGASTEAGLNALSFILGAKTPKMVKQVYKETSKANERKKMMSLVSKMKEGDIDPTTKLIGVDKKTGETTQIGPLSLLDEQEDLTPIQRQRMGQYIQQSPAAKRAIVSGLSDVDVSFFQGVRGVDKKNVKRMLKMARMGIADQRYRENNSLLNVVGDGMKERYRFIKARNKQAGRKIRQIVNRDANIDVDFSQPIDRFARDMEELGLRLNTKGKLSLEFTPNSAIEESSAAANYLSGIVNRMATRGGNKLIDGHKLKLFIQENGGLADVGKGLTGQAKVAVAKLRSRINKKLQEASPDYAQVNKQYSDTIDVLNRYQKLAGKDVDLTDVSGGERLAKIMRTIFSNYKKGDDVKDLTALTDRIAGKYGAEFKDSMNDQAMTAIKLRDLFKLEKSQTFQKQIQAGVGDTAVQTMIDPQTTLLMKGAEKVSDRFKKSERDQFLEALKAIEDLINE